MANGAFIFGQSYFFALIQLGLGMATIMLFVFAHSFPPFFYYHYVCLCADNDMSLDGHNNCVFVSIYVRFELVASFFYNIPFICCHKFIGQCFCSALFIPFSYNQHFVYDELLTIYQWCSLNTTVVKSQMKANLMRIHKEAIFIVTMTMV